jgi:hypothetical protein
VDFFEPRTGVDARVAEAVDALAERFGSGTVTRAALLDNGEDSTDIDGKRAAVRVTRTAP